MRRAQALRESRSDSGVLHPGSRLLDCIEGPADLKQLSAEQTVRLAEEIRHVIVRSESVTNHDRDAHLGLIGVTLALHRVFDSPRDAILWDTGHQAYVHHLVTGRRGGGASTFPTPAASEHDWVENTHPSTVLSYAHGLATALDLHGEHGRRVVAVVGGGSIAAGPAYEALNNLGHSGRRVLVVLTDDSRSGPPNVGRLAAGLTRIRLAPGYVEGRDRAQRTLQRLPRIGRPLRRGVDGIRAAARDVVRADGGLFEALGVRYIGPVDGHDIAALEQVMVRAAAFDGPVVVHALTGNGNVDRPGPRPETDPVHEPDEYATAFAQAMVDLGERDPRIVAVTAATAGSSVLHPFRARWPERHLDLAGATQHAVTAAAGLAMTGMRPVVAVSSTALARAVDQVNLDVGLHRLPAVFCVDRAGVTGDAGADDHGTLDLALLCRVPGITILAPSSGQELRVMLDHAIGIEGGPVVIRHPEGAGRPAGPGVGSGLCARRLVEGHDVCILAVGGLVAASVEAARLLAREGLSTSVWDIRAVKPLDRAMLTEASRHGVVVTVEDGINQGGAGTAVADALAGTRVPVLVLGLPVAYLPRGDRLLILQSLGLDGRGIAAAALAASRRPRQPIPPGATVRRNAGGPVGGDVSPARHDSSETAGVGASPSGPVLNGRGRRHLIEQSSGPLGWSTERPRPPDSADAAAP